MNEKIQSNEEDVRKIPIAFHFVSSETTAVLYSTILLYFYSYYYARWKRKEDEMYLFNVRTFIYTY